MNGIMAAVALGGDLSKCRDFQLRTDRLPSRSNPEEQSQSRIQSPRSRRETTEITAEEPIWRGEADEHAEAPPIPGMLLYIDGSTHQWFPGERRYDLITVMDDATSEIYCAQLVEEESTRTVMADCER